MTVSRRNSVLGAVVVFVALGAVLWWAHRHYNPARSGGAALASPFRMSDRLASLKIEEVRGTKVFVFGEGPNRQEMSPDAFAVCLAQEQERKRDGGWMFRVFDITSLGGLFWVLLGLGGQFLFTGRMIVQWLASEKAKRSVVPPAFWWMSLCGSSLLIIYFAWRIDVVGILGQSTGWVVYLRNLWLLKKAADEAPNPSNRC